MLRRRDSNPSGRTRTLSRGSVRTCWAPIVATPRLLDANCRHRTLRSISPSRTWLTRRDANCKAPACGGMCMRSAGVLLVCFSVGDTVRDRSSSNQPLLFAHPIPKGSAATCPSHFACSNLLGCCDSQGSRASASPPAAMRQDNKTVHDRTLKSTTQLNGHLRNQLRAIHSVLEVSERSIHVDLVMDSDEPGSSQRATIHKWCSSSLSSSKHHPIVVPQV